MLPLLQFPSQGLFIHARRLLMDKNTLITTTYSGYIPTRLGLALLSRDVARPEWRRSPNCHMVPRRVAFLPTRRAPIDRYCHHPVSRWTPLRAKLAKPATQSSVNCSPGRMARVNLSSRSWHGRANCSLGRGLVRSVASEAAIR